MLPYAEKYDFNLLLPEFKGNVANVIIVDQWFNVKNTILKGEKVK